MTADSTPNVDDRSPESTDLRPVEVATDWQRQAPRIHPYERGKLCMALALGLSQREAEAWFDVSRGTIARLIELDPTFAAELDEYTKLATLHPLLRIQQAAGKSWRAAAWLRDYLARREGNTPAEELSGNLPLMSMKIRRVLYDEDSQIHELLGNLKHIYEYEKSIEFKFDEQFQSHCANLAFGPVCV